MKPEIYKIIDSFLTEAKDKYGKERSLEQLNKDRHLAVDSLEKLFNLELSKIVAELHTLSDPFPERGSEEVEIYDLGFQEGIRQARHLIKEFILQQGLIISK